MSITSYEQVEKQINTLGGKPTVLEALWDGDTQGWYLCLSVYIKKNILGGETSHYLGTVTFGGDIRLFTGEVPSWPEAALAKEIGKRAEEKYGLTFYFPSPDDPDDDCPRWTERHLAISCADCNKLIIPTTSEYLPKDICYHCHLEREWNEKIKTEKPCDDGVTFFLYKEGIYQNNGYCSYFDSFTVAPYIKDIVESRKSNELVSLVEINTDEIRDLYIKLRKDVKPLLDNYKKPEIDPKMSKFKPIDKKAYDGTIYELEMKFNDEHRKISNFMYSIETAEKALNEEKIFVFSFKNGMTYRDDTMLRFINYVSKGSASVEAICKRYEKILNEQEVMDTIEKLKRAGCLKTDGTMITLTDLAKRII
jgi:hypothetical protein